MTDATKAETPFPFQLEQVLFTKMLVEAVPGHVMKEGLNSLSPSSHIEIEPIEGETSKYVVSMRTSFNKEGSVDAPYIVEMHCMSVFAVDANSLSKEETMRGLTITGHNVLYAATREAIGWLSGRQPYGPLILGLSVLKPTAAATKQP